MAGSTQEVTTTQQTVAATSNTETKWFTTVQRMKEWLDHEQLLQWMQYYRQTLYHQRKPIIGIFLVHTAGADGWETKKWLPLAQNAPSAVTLIPKEIASISAQGQSVASRTRTQMLSWISLLTFGCRR